MSARRAGAAEFLITGAGTWLDRLDRNSFTVVRISDATTVGGPAVAPSTEVALHAETYRVRADVNAIVHLHPQATVLLSSLGERIRLITTDHAFYLRRIAVTPYRRPGTADLARLAAQAAADGTNCVVLAHHGCSVLGETIEIAHRRAVNLEEAARLTYRALLLTGALSGRSIAECPGDVLVGDAI